MATGGLKFNCVALNVRIRFNRYFKQRRGQFGRWFKPTLKGYEPSIRLGAMLTSRGGYLVVSFLLPLSSEHWAMSIVQSALERVPRVGSLVYHKTALDSDSPLASTVMDDAWSTVLICVRLS